MLQKFVIAVIVGALKNEDVQRFLIKAAKDIVESAVANKILPALSVAIAGALDAAFRQIPGVENIKDVGAVANAGRETLDRLIPDFDTGIKVIDDVMDIWRPKK